MISYPTSFYGTGEATSGIDKEWNVKSSEFSTKCSVPREFEGSGTAFSPEDFFLLSLQNCFIATFKVFAHYSKLNFDSLKVKAELIVDKDEKQKPVMKKLLMKIEFTNVSDQKKADILVKKTLENGFILQSVKTEITAELEYN